MLSPFETRELQRRLGQKSKPNFILSFYLVIVKLGSRRGRAGRARCLSECYQFGIGPLDKTYDTLLTDAARPSGR